MTDFHDQFDPYYQWLQIPPNEQPPDHYRLLGLSKFESDGNVIENAADQRMLHIRTFQSGERGRLSQKIMNELSKARVTLLDPAKKSVYDQALQNSLNAVPTIGALPEQIQSGTEPLTPSQPIVIDVGDDQRKFSFLIPLALLLLVGLGALLAGSFIAPRIWALLNSSENPSSVDVNNNTTDVSTDGDNVIKPPVEAGNTGEENSTGNSENQDTSQTNSDPNSNPDSNPDSDTNPGSDPANNTEDKNPPTEKDPDESENSNPESAVMTSASGVVDDPFELASTDAAKMNPFDPIGMDPSLLKPDNPNEPVTGVSPDDPFGFATKPKEDFSKSDIREIERITKELKDVAVLLGRRQFALAVRKTKLLDSKAKLDVNVQRLRGMKQVIRELEQFWTNVSKGSANLRPNRSFFPSDQEAPVRIIESSKQHLIYKYNDKNHRFLVTNLPLNIAFPLAEDFYEIGSNDHDMAVATVYLVSAANPSNSKAKWHMETARTMLKDLHEAGSNDTDIFALLTDPLEKTKQEDD